MVGIHIGAASMFSNMAVQQINSTSEYISKGNKISISERYLHSYFIATLFITAKKWNNLSGDRWMDKENVIHTQRSIIQP